MSTYAGCSQVKGGPTAYARAKPMEYPDWVVHQMR